MAKADLHIHTTASDGRMSPVDVVHAAIAHKLDLIAITDHDTLKGFREAEKVVSDMDQIELFPAIEITSDFNGRECHLLAYCFDPNHHLIKQLVRDHYHSRLNRGKWIIGQLSRKGFELDIDEVKAVAHGGNIGRPHIATVLLDKGYVASYKEAFIRYLSDQQLGTIYNEYYSHTKVIETVKKAGGVVVIAHPGRLYSQKELKALVSAGVDGIEVIHPSHKYKIQKKMEEFAESHDLLTTGGSDFHGSKKKYQRYFGIVTINARHAHKLRRMADQRKQ
ncbi:MAG TPA: PHP domain-containing protein [Fodinibius sp.]|nr:PHP domain-containing protein [Fodinibius sp.]